MSKTVIKVEGVGKQYRLGMVSTGTIIHDINRSWHKMRGKEDPYLKLGDTNNRNSDSNSDLVWALKDINFEVQQGEVLGIIGKNGAGKSTLLKILSQVTTPTVGQIKVKGRIASLLEVGTGFHPELSGRENIFLNGAIMGMTKTEIKNKFDEIVEFSGIGRYLDTPVKRYSSGMYVRLAFAVAAHLDPEILVVDEVLAVGDAEFQKKAIGKMQEVSQGQGRTVLFVSHNIGSIQRLCQKGILLKDGQIDFYGNIEDTITRYMHRVDESDDLEVDVAESERERKDFGEKLKFIKCGLTNKEGKFVKNYKIGEKVGVQIQAVAKTDINDVSIIVGVDTQYNEIICTAGSEEKGVFYDVKKGETLTINVCFEDLILNKGNFNLRIAARADNKPLDLVRNVKSIKVYEVTSNDSENKIEYRGLYGLIKSNTTWTKV